MPNYFANAEVAARYARARPCFKGNIAERISSLTGVLRFNRALDVGCGTGRSAIALAEIADNVIAIDESEHMLAHCPPRPNIEYRRGVAEELSFDDHTFDLVSVGSALHWFDQKRFFEQCRRVLCENGWLLVYNDHFTAHMRGNATFKRWVRTRYAKRYRVRARGLRDFDEQTAVEQGFRVVHRAAFDREVPFTREDFIAYLLTHTNTLAAIAAGEATAESVRDWLELELTPYLPDGTTGALIFKSNLWMLRR